MHTHSNQRISVVDVLTYGTDILGTKPFISKPQWHHAKDALRRIIIPVFNEEIMVWPNYTLNQLNHRKSWNMNWNTFGSYENIFLTFIRTKCPEFIRYLLDVALIKFFLTTYFVCVFNKQKCYLDLDHAL